MNKVKSQLYPNSTQHFTAAFDTHDGPRNTDTTTTTTATLSYDPPVTPWVCYKKLLYRAQYPPATTSS